MWNILDHIDHLTILKELNSEYVCECPVCNGQRLTISKSTGAYSCWTTECPSADIREAIAPNSKPRHSYSEPKQRLKPAVIHGKVELARFPKPVKADLANETRYNYSQSQYVQRYYQDGTKFTIPYFNGSRGKGDRLWFPYRIDEVEQHCFQKWVLIVEGEKCVEYARELGLVAMTWQGSSWTPSDFMAAIMILRSSQVRGICYYPDADIPGYRKAYKLWQTCAKPLLQRHKFPMVVLDPFQVWQECPEGGDIADWSKQGLASVERLEAVANSSRNDIVDEKKFLPF